MMPCTNKGDGNTDSNPVHSYRRPGTYIVTVTATCTGCGVVRSAALEVTVNPVRCEVEFDPNKVNIRNLNQTLSDGFDKSYAVVWSGSIVDLKSLLTAQSTPDQINWSVSGIEGSVDSQTGVLSYGSDPSLNNIYDLRVTAKIDNLEICNNPATPKSVDKLVVVVVSAETNVAFNNWAISASQDTAWLSLLPPPYETLGGPDPDPEPQTCNPQRWKAPTGLVSFYHPGAYHEMRSESVSGGAGHQATYNGSGRLIESGAGAGTADRVTPSNPFVLIGADFSHKCATPVHAANAMSV